MNLKQAQQKEDNDEEIDNLLSKIDDMENDLEEADNELVKKVIMHHKNGDLYAARAQKMREAREAKAALKVAPAAASNESTEAPVNESTPAPVTEPTPVSKTETTPISKIEEKEKKETNWLLWGVLGVAGIFVGINLFKNKR